MNSNLHIRKTLGVAIVLWGAVAFASALSLSEVAADKRLWPPNVVVSESFTAKLPTGEVALAAGKQFPLVEVTTNGPVVRIMNTPVLVPAGKTNLMKKSALLNRTLAARKRYLATEGKGVDPTRRVYDDIKGRLVVFENGRLRRIDDRSLRDGKLFAIYFSSYTCPPCRRFLPRLIEFYKAAKPEHPEFEVINVSADPSARMLLDYMRKAEMPFPSVAFDEIRNLKLLPQLAGIGLPMLVLVDASGRVLSHSQTEPGTSDPDRVLRDIERVLSAK